MIYLKGGIAAGLTVLTSQPIDVIRTRLVAQGEPRVSLIAIYPTYYKVGFINSIKISKILEWYSREQKKYFKWSN